MNPQEAVMSRSMNQAKTDVHQMDKFWKSLLVITIIELLWFLVATFASIKISIFFTLLLVFAWLICGDTYLLACQNIAYICFVHPFDLGDSCIIDGVEMKVQEINVMTTVFLNSDKEKVIYPNKLLATKTIMVCP